MDKTDNSQNPKNKRSSRDCVLNVLESAKGEYLSGEYLASELNLSRTAVWKAVKRLRAAGYSIDAVTNRGYALHQKHDILSEESIRRYISELAASGEINFGVTDKEAQMIGAGAINLESLQLEVSTVVDSTNDVCLRRATQGEHSSFAAIAGCQTRGRGRRGRTFFSPDGSGLYMSMLLRPFGINGYQAQKFTTLAAVAVAEAIEAVAGIPAQIKWVNDVYVRGRKVCGILTEASFNLEDGTLDYAVVGIGINVYEPKDGFPESIQDRAGFLAPALGTYDPERNRSFPSGETLLANGGRNRLAAEVLSRFYTYCIAELRAVTHPDQYTGSKRRYMEEYRRRCFVIGHEVDVLKAGSLPVHALVTGLDDDCHLLVRYGDGREEALSSGEISIRI